LWVDNVELIVEL